MSTVSLRRSTSPFSRLLSLSKEVVEKDFYDELVYERATKASELLKNLPSNLNFPTADVLPKDVFFTLYKVMPTLKEDDDVHPAYLFNKTLLEKAMETEEYERLKKMTTLDWVNSTIATIHFTKYVVEELSKDENALNTLNELCNLNANELLNGLSPAPHDPNSNERSARLDVPNLKKTVEEALGESAVKVLKEALKKTADDLSLCRGYDDSPSSPIRVSPNEKIILAEELAKNSKLKEILKMLGKIKRLESASRLVRVKRAELAGVTLGKDLSKALPSEVAKLNHPALKYDVLSKFSGGRLLVYDDESSEKSSGNFVACLDLSGSMEGARELWAKAVVLAAAANAYGQGKKCKVVLFSERVKDVADFEPTLRFAKWLASTFYNGGTNFEEPLEVATKNLNDDSDVLFVTDGECEVSDEFLDEFTKAKKAKDFKVVTVLIHARETDAVKAISDEIVSVTELSEKEAVNALNAVR